MRNKFSVYYQFTPIGEEVQQFERKFDFQNSAAIFFANKYAHLRHSLRNGDYSHYKIVFRKLKGDVINSYTEKL